MAAHQQAVAALSAAQTAAAAHQQQAVAQNLLFGDYASNLNTVLGQPGSAAGTHRTHENCHFEIAIFICLNIDPYSTSLRCSRQCLQTVNNLGDRPIDTHLPPTKKCLIEKEHPIFVTLQSFSLVENKFGFLEGPQVTSNPVPI